MVQKLREILLTRYIGSILIAALCWQALIVLIEYAIKTLFLAIGNQRAHSPFEPPQPTFRWDNLAFSIVTIALYLLVAYALAQWLYPPAPLPLPPSEEEGDPSPHQSEP